MPTESIVESQTSIFEHIVGKRRRSLSEEQKFHELFVRMNSPPLHSSSKLLTKALNKHFGRNWHLTKRDKRSLPESVAIQKLKNEKPSLPFLREIKSIYFFPGVCTF